MFGISKTTLVGVGSVLIALGHILTAGQVNAGDLNAILMSFGFVAAGDAK